MTDGGKLVADSFVNSQEWTLGRSVPDLRLVRKQTVYVCLSVRLFYITSSCVSSGVPGTLII